MFKCRANSIKGNEQDQNFQKRLMAQFAPKTEIFLIKGIVAEAGFPMAWSRVSSFKASTFVFALVVFSLTNFLQVESRPVKDPLHNSLNAKCPVENPVTILGEKRRLLQHFTPDLMCASAEESQETMDDVLTKWNSNSNSPPAERLAGCSEAELASLSGNSPPDPASACQYHMTCQYDPFRFPAVLYEAARSQHSTWCPGDGAFCLPVYSKVVVLRKTTVDSCPSWRFELTNVATSFACLPIKGTRATASTDSMPMSTNDHSILDSI